MKTLTFRIFLFVYFIFIFIAYRLIIKNDSLNQRIKNLSNEMNNIRFREIMSLFEEEDEEEEEEKLNEEKRNQDLKSDHWDLEENKPSGSFSGKAPIHSVNDVVKSSIAVAKKSNGIHERYLTLQDHWYCDGDDDRSHNLFVKDFHDSIVIDLDDCIYYYNSRCVWELEDTDVRTLEQFNHDFVKSIVESI